MVAAFFSLYFGVHCFRRARLNERNVFIWPITGAVIFIVVVNVTVYIAANVLVLSGIGRNSIYFIYGTLPPGLIVGYVVTSAIVNKLLPARSSSDRSPAQAHSKELLPELEEKLISAVFDRDSDTVAQLLSEGADVHRKDNDGYTALDYAQLKGGQIEELVSGHAKNH